MPFDSNVREGLIYRLKKTPRFPTNYPYLVVSDNTDESADVLSITDFRRIREKLKKKVKTGTGLEVTVASARKMDAVGIGKWLNDIEELYSFCHSSRCQLILSSGASSMHEMVSGPCLDAILKNCGIDHEKQWRDMNIWLETKLSRRVSVRC